MSIKFKELAKEYLLSEKVTNSILVKLRDAKFSSRYYQIKEVLIKMRLFYAAIDADLYKY